MYCADSSVCARSRAIASSSSMTIVPVASCVSVWSILTPISAPGVSFPSTTWSAMSFCATFRPMLTASSQTPRHEGTGRGFLGIGRRVQRRSAMNPAERVVRGVDAFQQRHRVTGFAFGVVKKFGDHRAGSLAALVAYYAFLAIFPLLLLLVTILGFVAQHNSDFQHRLVDSALSDFPIIGDQIARNVKSLSATGLGLAISLIGSARA